MVKPTSRMYSTTTREALGLIGQMIRLARIERQMTAGELAIRAGFSRDLLQRIERGNPGSSIGAVFEAATIVGVNLFEADPPSLTDQRRATQGRLALLPRRVTHKSRMAVNDDF